jgi:hypothetical protein
MTPAVIGQKCNGSCSLSGTWWLDLDAAELANPGMFVNMPLVVILSPGSTNAGIFGTATLTATMQKK